MVTDHIIMTPNPLLLKSSNLHQRLFSKFNMVPSPHCVLCRVLHDNVHLFCECELVRESWFWIRQRILGMFSIANGRTSNFELLNLMFESCVMDNEVIWILGIYVQLVWKIVICKKKMLKLEIWKSSIFKYANPSIHSWPS